MLGVRTTLYLVVSIVSNTKLMTFNAKLMLTGKDTTAWRKASKAFLVAHPLCAECLKHGITKPATEVDHIIPHKGNKDLFWNQNNWQSLCHECHSRKTVKEDGGFGNKITRKHPRGS